MRPPTEAASLYLEAVNVIRINQPSAADKDWSISSQVAVWPRWNVDEVLASLFDPINDNLIPSSIIRVKRARFVAGSKNAIGHGGLPRMEDSHS